MNKLVDDREQKVWLPIIILISVVLGVTLWYLYPKPREFPMDDTYIHFIYAQNLADHHQLMFNFPDEVGVGSTSILWVLLLSLGYSLGFSLNFSAKAFGITALILVGISMFGLLKPKFGTRRSLLCSISIVLAGNVLWFALSGMETVLFLALGVLSLLVYRTQKWGVLGILLGLSVLTRPEGLVLVFVIGMVEVLHQKHIPRKILITGVIVIILCAPWFGYLYYRTGHLLPTSAIGKQLSSRIGMQYVLEKNPGFGLVARYPVLLYLGAWVGYLVEFGLGGMALPPPHIPIGTALGNTNYTLSIWAIIGITSAIIPLLWKSFKNASRRHLWQEWLNDDHLRPFLVLILWCLLHNIAYLVILPVPGTASRYGALNYILLWLALSFGLLALSKKNWKRCYYSIWLLVIGITNTVYWNGVYDANLDYMTNVRISAANYLRNNIPENELCVVSDVGAIRFFSQRPILDLGGLIDPTLGQIYLEGDLDHYIASKGATCLILPGRKGTTEDGWFDLAEIMGVASTPIFKLREEAIYEIDRDRWLRGYLATNNYQATVTIYQLEYSE